MGPLIADLRPLVCDFRFLGPLSLPWPVKSFLYFTGLLHWPRPMKWPRLFHRAAFEISAFSVSTFQLFDLVDFNFLLSTFYFDFVLSQFLFLILRFQLFRDGAANFYCSTPEFILISITYASAEGVKYLFVFNH